VFGITLWDNDRTLKHQSNPLTRRLGPSVRTHQSHETGHGFGSWNHNKQRDTKRRGADRERERLTLTRLATRENDASRSACAREWSASRRRLRASTCEATALLSSPTLEAAAGAASAGDAAGEGEAARGLATSGERAAGLALVLSSGFGEAEEPGIRGGGGARRRRHGRGQGGRGCAPALHARRGRRALAWGWRYRAWS
jgi:hypothetical protein